MNKNICSQVYTSAIVLITFATCVLLISFVSWHMSLATRVFSIMIRFDSWHMALAARVHLIDLVQATRNCPHVYCWWKPLIPSSSVYEFTVRTRHKSFLFLSLHTLPTICRFYSLPAHSTTLRWHFSKSFCGSTVTVGLCMPIAPQSACALLKSCGSVINVKRFTSYRICEAMLLFVRII